MAKASSIYRRLTGRRRTLFGYSQLWLAPGHVLLVKSTRFTEQYQRFSLQDIQAVVITHLADRTALQVTGAGVAILWTLGFLAVSPVFAKGFFAVTGAIALGLVIIDMARGPRCRCHLYTAVSRELLTSVGRLHTARSFLETIRPAIDAVQGTIAVERIPDLQTSASPVTGDQPPEVPQPPGYLPETLFALFLVNAVVVLIDLRFPRTDVASILPTTVFAEIVILIVALARRGTRDPRRFIYVLMIAAIFCIGWDSMGLIRGLGTWMESVMEAGRRGRPAAITFATWAPFNHGAALFAASWRMAAGAIGLVAAWFGRSPETSG